MSTCSQASEFVLLSNLVLISNAVDVLAVDVFWHRTFSQKTNEQEIEFDFCYLSDALCFAGCARHPLIPVKAHFPTWKDLILMTWRQPCNIITYVGLVRFSEAPVSITSYIINGHGPGRMRKTWSDCIRLNISKFNKSDINPKNLLLFRKSLMAKIVTEAR